MATADIANELRAEEQLAASLNDYAGEWVAIRDHNVICHAGTLRELLEAVETQSIGPIDRILEVSADSGIGCFF